MAIPYLLSEFLPEIWLEENAGETHFVFCFDVWPGTRTLARIAVLLKPNVANILLSNF